MADNVEGFLKGLLTLEVTTVVVDEIPSEVMTDMRDQLDIMTRKMAGAESADAPAGGAKQATSVSNEGARESAPAEAKGAKESAPAEAKGAKPPPAQRASLKKKFGAIAEEAARAKGAAMEKAKTGRSSRESTARMTPEQIEEARKEASYHERRSERARMMIELLPDEDEELETLPAERRVALRRMAMLRDYPIALHTTISVSGDLTNLCAREHAGPSGAAIRELHAEGVAQAIGWWKALAEGVASFLGQLFGAIKNARSASPGGGGTPER